MKAIPSRFAPSRLSQRDCFAEPVLGRRSAPTRGLAMTPTEVVIARSPLRDLGLVRLTRLGRDVAERRSNLRGRRFRLSACGSARGYAITTFSQTLTFVVGLHARRAGCHGSHSALTNWILCAIYATSTNANARLAMPSLPVYSEPALGCPLFSASPDCGLSRFSAGEMLTLADNFLQKQQKQQDRRFGVDCGWWAGSGSPGAKLSH